MDKNNDLKMFCGNEIAITDKISMRQPSLREIYEYGEERYLRLISMFISTPFNMIYPLTEMGIDFTTISNFRLFTLFSKTIKYSESEIIFPSIDFTTGKIGNIHKTTSTGKPMKAEEEVIVFSNGAFLTEKNYQDIVDYLRRVNHIEEDWRKTVGTESTKKRLIREAKEEYLNSIKFPKKFKSVYLPLISSMTNCADFKYDYSTVWDLKLFQFFESVERISSHENINHLYTGIYNGCVEFDKVKNKLNWMK